MRNKAAFKPGDIVRFDFENYTTAPDYDRDWRVVDVMQNGGMGSGWQVDVVRNELPDSTPLNGATVNKEWWWGCQSKLVLAADAKPYGRYRPIKFA